MNSLFEELRNYIREDIDNAIKYADLSKLNQEEKERLIDAGYNNKHLLLENINDLLIDYSDKELNDSDLLELFSSNSFVMSLEKNGEIYLLYPIFKYLVENSDEAISTKAVSMFLDTYKKYFRDFNLETSNADDSLSSSEFFNAIDLLYKADAKNELLDRDYNKDVIGISRLNWYAKKKLSNRVDYCEFCKTNVDFSDLFDIIRLYIDGDFSNCSNTYIYNMLLDKYEQTNDELEKEEIKFLINTIDCAYLIPSRDFNSDVFNRLLDKCDQNNISLSENSVEKFTNYYKMSNKDLFGFKNRILSEFKDYTLKCYEFNIYEFLEYLKQRYRYNDTKKSTNYLYIVEYHKTRDDFPSFCSEQLTLEVLLDLLGLNYNHFVNLFPGHKSLDEFRKNNEESKNKELKHLEDDYNKNHEFLNKYMNDLEIIKNMDMDIISIELYAYKNIPEGDRKKFLNLVNFFIKTGYILSFKYNKFETKDNTFAEIFDMALKELSNSDYSEFDSIVSKYVGLLTRLNAHHSSHYKRLFRSKCEQNRGLIATNFVLKNIEIINSFKNSNLYVELYYRNNSFINAILNMNIDNNSELKDIYDKLIKDKEVFYNDISNAGIIHFDIDRMIELLPIYINSKDEFFNKISYINRDKTTICNNYYLIVLNFINSNYMSREEYMRKENISLSLFTDALNFCRVNNSELVNEYDEKIYKLSQMRFYPIVSNAREIINYILNGFNDAHGNHRDFEYLDYKLMTKMSIPVFIDFIKDKKLITDQNDYRTVIRWLKSREVNVPLSFKEINDTTYIINGIEVTDDIKNSIVNYLKSRGIFIDARVFNQALKRYMNGELLIDSNSFDTGGARKH